MRYAAALATIAILVGACGGDGDSSARDLGEATADLTAANNELASLRSENTSLASGLETAQARVDELEEDQASAEADAEAMELALGEQQGRIDQLVRETGSLRTAFDSDIRAARAFVRAAMPEAACAAGAATASVKGDTGITLTAVVQHMTSDEDERESLLLAVGDDSDIFLAEQSQQFSRCRDERIAQIETEKMEAEQSALADLLPIVCLSERYHGHYLNASGHLETTASYEDVDTVGYVTAVFAEADSLERGWFALKTVATEKERCAALPRLMIANNSTMRVGDGIEAGTYRSVRPVSDACYWSRNDAQGNIRANQFTESAAQIVIGVSASDYSVENSGCGLLVSGALPAAVPEG